MSAFVNCSLGRAQDEVVCQSLDQPSAASAKPHPAERGQLRSDHGEKLNDTPVAREDFEELGANRGQFAADVCGRLPKVASRRVGNSLSCLSRLLRTPVACARPVLSIGSTGCEIRPGESANSNTEANNASLLSTNK